MRRWETGRTDIEDMLGEKLLERVPPDIEAARRLIAKARKHLETATLVADSDVDMAYDAMHSANRKALTAILLVQGLRPTTAAGHTGVFRSATAQLHPPLGPKLSPYTRIRRTRNMSDYLDELTATADDVRADLPLCRDIVDAADEVISVMPPF